MNASATLDIRSFVNERKMSSYQWILVALCFCIVAVDGMDVAIMGFVAPSITSAWGISKSAFGFVMGAAPIGLAIGALIAGSSSDWFGRRKVLLGSVAVFGIATILTAHAANVEQMAIMRLITGLGLGAAMPNATTLVTEYVPERSRSFLIALMFTGFNFGSGVIGFIAAALIPRYGWESVLVFGGALPLLLLPVLFALLPESARFMTVKGQPAAKIGAVLGRVCRANLAQYASFEVNEPAPPSKQPLAVLFSSGYGLRTIALWVTYFMGLLVIYLTTSWLPMMIKDAGLPIERAAQITAMFQLGGTVGAIIVGLAMDRFGPSRMVGLAYFFGAIVLLVLGFNGVMSAWIALLVGAVGFFLSGAQTGLNAFAPGCYPTVGRATGVSWMLGIGRLGSILGSTIGGVLLSQGLGFQAIFMILAIPATAAALAIFRVRTTTQPAAGRAA
ncbi:MFS transporter [Solimonas marina]|uniref:Aromatic acid/H+ symport family MFS transporter n=1 Tax=Solimonas marina TaxID=2714601 RepID=A0A969WBJ4_9GAMM|nr:aromatic acid/H+ symport family MFS transporter [Solimonas marina]NKF24137.1 aromatic acid/H+ symport family MFS transporter [Solimonas marina]